MTVTSIYETLRDAVRASRPVVLATVVEGPSVGAKILLGPDLDPVGTLGDPDLDRVVTRDARGELEAGTNVVRHYGAHGEAGPISASAPPRASAACRGR